MKKKLERLRALSNRLALASGTAVVAGSSMAAGEVDVSVVTTALAAAVAVGTVGAAKLAMIVGGKVWGWLQRFV